MTLNQLYPALAAPFLDWVQLCGLDDGAFFCQPWWWGDRAILSAEGAVWPPDTARPVSYRLTEQARRRYATGLVLDVTVGTRGQIRVNDIDSPLRMGCPIVPFDNCIPVYSSYLLEI